MPESPEFNGMNQSEKEATRAAYDALAEQKKKEFEQNFHILVEPLARLFLSEVRGKCIVDLGSGPGVHADYFHHHGLDVTCVDYSEKMLMYCKAKGLKVRQVDIEEFTMPDRTMDGVWAFASISHLRKVSISTILDAIYRMLKPGGILGLGLFEGHGEGWWETSPELKRWFSYFSDEEIRKFLGDRFEVVHFRRSAPEGFSVMLFYVLRKR